jgi:CRAL/TRIO domain
MSSDATAGQPPDLYGQVHPVETPELIGGKLKEFEAELAKIPPKDKVDLAEAQRRCPKLLTDDFKLMFLRCEVFNADLAAKRYCAYWTKRVDIFGPDRAFLPLTLKEGGALQDNDTHTAFGLGVMTLLQAKDPTGRSIIYFDPGRQDKSLYGNHRILVRTFWYVVHAALEDEETQRKGIVVISDPGRAKFSQFDSKVVQLMIGSFRGGLPVRLSAIHIVHPPAFISFIWPVVNLFLGKRLRQRVRVHSGKEEKVLEELEAKFGLTKAMLPTTIGGMVELRHQQWLASRSSSGL